MATNVNNQLPEDFVLDDNKQEQAQDSQNLPQGFQLDSPTAQQEPKTLQEAMPKVPPIITDAIVAPMVETMRGLYRSAGNFYGKLDAITKLGEKTMGIQRGGLFENWSKMLEQEAERLPETGMGDASKTVYELIGGSVPVITEFAIASKVPGLKGQEPLSQVGQFAVLEALDEYKDNPEFKSLVKGAQEGVLSGMAVIGAFGLGVPVIKAMHKGGTKAGKTLLTWLTGDRKLADDFVKNPRKYNVNIRNKVKTSADIKAENQAVLDELKIRYANEKQLFRDNLKRKQQINDIKFKDAQDNLKLNMADAKQSIATGKNLDEVAKNASKAIEQNKIALQEQAINVFDDGLTKYNIVRKQYGDNVEQAVNNVLQKDPLAKFPVKAVTKKVDKLMNTAPFCIGDKGQFIPRTAAGRKDVGEAKVLDGIVNEFNSRVEAGDLTIGYLQFLKKDLQKLTDTYYKAGDNELGLFYKQFRDIVNPVNLADDLVKSGGKGITVPIKALADANAKYSGFMKRYDRAMKYYYTKNPRGEYIPNPNKVIRTIKGNDLATLREMKIADQGLEKGDQILPKMQKLVSNADKVEMQQKAIVKSLKRKAASEYAQLTEASRKSLTELQKKQRGLRFEEKQKISNQIKEFNTNKDAEYKAILDTLNSMETFYKNQDVLRQFSPSSKTGASLIQHILGFSGASATLRGNIALGGPQLLAALMMSPNMAANSIKTAQSEGQIVSELLQSIMRSKGLQRVLGTKAGEK